MEDILDAIADAHVEWAHLSTLEDVRLCLYQKGTAASINAQLRARLEGISI